MHSEKHQFEVKDDRRYQSVGRGGYLVNGLPWYSLYFNMAGYGYGGYYGTGGYGGSGNNQNSNETAQNGFGQEAYDGTATGSGEGTGYDGGSGAL